MSEPCRKFIQGWPLCLTAILAVCAAAPSAHAALAEDVSQFLTDFDRLGSVRTEIQGDRDAMAAHLQNESELGKDVRHFFADRAEAHAVRALKAVDRKQMRITLNYKPAKLTKPVKSAGNLAEDVQRYLSAYDGWIAAQALVASDLVSMRGAVTSNGNALETATKSFFDHSRQRLQNRVQWQSDVRAMKKDVSFKGTGKPAPPPGSTLNAHVTEFLSDRATWEALGLQLDADRNNLRSALSGGDLTAAVNKFLITRRARFVKGGELALDRMAMRKDVSSRDRLKERKANAAVGAKDLDSDEEDSTLEESSDGSGE